MIRAVSLIAAIGLLGCTDSGAVAREKSMPPPPPWSELASFRELSEMVLIDGREGFRTGSREHPPQTVHDIDDFYLATIETTQALWTRVQGSCPAIGKGDDRPVENVTWIEVVQFLNRLSRSKGLDPAYDPERNFARIRGANGFRLPTSAEWELACRGESVTRFAWGEEFDEAFCVPPVTAAEFRNLDETRDSRTVAVGSRQSNPTGLFDLAGNVSEWCDDVYERADDWRVIRGGSWADIDRRPLESRWSSGWMVDDRLPTIGFRIARSRADEDRP